MRDKFILFKQEFVKKGRAHMENLLGNEAEKPFEGLEAFVEDFLSRRQNELHDLHVAAEKKDFQLPRKVAHDWKGFSRPYGFGHLEDLSQELREAAVEEDQAKVEEVIRKAATYLEIKKKSLN